MDKLKELLGKAGVSNELIDGICEEFERLSVSIKEQSNKELAERIQRAKKVCLEEISKEKTSLARKVKVFLESKARSFEEAAARQRRIDESESATKVRRAVEVLTDGENGSNAVGEDVGRVAADRKLISRLEKALTSVREERDTALLRSKRAFGIAENAIKRNQLFETKLRELGALDEGKKLPDFIKNKKDEKDEKKSEKTDSKPSNSDDEPADAKSECNESTEKPAEKVRLSEDRTVKAKSKVAQPILKESQERTVKPKAESSDADPEISRIAGLIPDRE